MLIESHVRLLSVLVLLVPASAGAIEGESSLSVTPRFSALRVEVDDVESSGVGGGLSLDYQRGFSDTWWFRGAIAGAFHDGGLWNGTATLGLTYAVDVLRYVPYLGAGVGGAVVGGDALSATQVRPLLELGAGVDVLESRTFSWGVDARVSAYLDGLVLFTIGPRFSWRWGYF